MMLTLRNYNKKTGGSAGQTLVIAIMVMFLLALVAAIFIAIVARNMFRSERFSHVDAVAQIAEAGVRYADKMLTSSEDGADWRPQPDNHGVELDSNGLIVFDSGLPKSAVDWDKQRDNNPDFKWTRAYWKEELPVGSPEGMGYAGPTGGFTSFDSGDGRFLLRVSYNPNPKAPNSKYIKIESIGRWGIFDQNDPTTYKGLTDTLLRREITAFKPIGLTDYLRFVTNKDNRSIDMPLGWQGNAVHFGRSSAESKYGARGGSVRVNGNLMWYGDVNLRLRGTNQLATNIDDSVTSDYVPVDHVEVSGDIKIADGSNVSLKRLNLDGSAIDPSSISLYSSDDTNFATVDGFYRDGRDSTGNTGARGVKRIEAPLIDQPDPTGTTTRYRLLSLNSGERINNNGRWFNRGNYGWGRGIYIGNTRDKQDESETLIGGYSVQADWLKPNSPMSTYWKGPYYDPPAAVIVLNPYDTDGDGYADLSITRTDATVSGRKWVWFDAWGNRRPEWGQTITMPYPNAEKGRRILWKNSDGSWDDEKYIDLDGNGVIYAEGNIRIKGMLPPETQLTVVSGKNIYIDGNLLKYRDPKGTISDTDAYRGTSETNTCGLALLARENICVNTTQFFAPENSISADDVGSDAQDGQPPFHVIVNDSPDSQLRCTFGFGPWESESSNAPDKWCVYLRHSGQYGPSYINCWLNPTASAPDWGILWLNVGGTPNYIYGVGDPSFTPYGWGIGTAFVDDVFELTPGINADLITIPGVENLLQIGLDQRAYTRNNYLMGGMAIQPMDIRIEAVLYAQEGSFFVLPGNWFNQNPSDIDASSSYRQMIASINSNDVRLMFPYFGQSLDVRVIIDGAISENVPAPIGAVGEWMSKWGKIPDTYGSTNIPTAHPGEGLTVLYDDHVGWPYSNLDPAVNTLALTPIRTDKYGRALPIAPRLPVSGSLIYFGDVM